VLAGLYPAAPGKRSAAVSQFREAAHKASASGDVWFMLAELLAPTDPAGPLQSSAQIQSCSCRHLSSFASGMLTYRQPCECISMVYIIWLLCA
jgi:hypothetical protein